VRVLWLAAGLALAALPACGDSDALKKIVIGQCVPHEKAGKGPAPCAEVDLAGGFAVLKDKRGNTQFLLIPTKVVTGIEDRAEILGGHECVRACVESARRDGAGRRHVGHLPTCFRGADRVGDHQAGFGIDETLLDGRGQQCPSVGHHRQ